MAWKHADGAANADVVVTFPPTATTRKARRISWSLSAIPAPNTELRITRITAAGPPLWAVHVVAAGPDSFAWPGAPVETLPGEALVARLTAAGPGTTGRLTVEAE